MKSAFAISCMTLAISFAMTSATAHADGIKVTIPREVMEDVCRTELGRPPGEGADLRLIEVLASARAATPDAVESMQERWTKAVIADARRKALVEAARSVAASAEGGLGIAAEFLPGPDERLLWACAYREGKMGTPLSGSTAPR